MNEMINREAVYNPPLLSPGNTVAAPASTPSRNYSPPSCGGAPKRARHEDDAGNDYLRPFNELTPIWQHLGIAEPFRLSAPALPSTSATPSNATTYASNYFDQGRPLPPTGTSTTEHKQPEHRPPVKRKRPRQPEQPTTAISLLTPKPPLTFDPAKEDTVLFPIQSDSPLIGFTNSKDYPIVL